MALVLEECDSLTQMLQDLVVDLNKLVKIRFSDGDELLVRIFENLPAQSTNEFPVNKESPLGKALLGHTKGEQIEYQVEGSIQQVAILEIK